MSNTLPYPFDAHRYMGTVTQVGATSVRANLPNAGDSGVRLHHGNRVAGGEVGEFVVIECDELAVFGRVLEVRLPERERLSVEPALGLKDDLHPVGMIQVLATIDLARKRALSGISRYPRLGSRIYSAHPELIRWLIAESKHKDNCPNSVILDLACLTDDHSVSLAISPEQLFGRHCAVLGTTGGGKSWTVARMLEEACKFKSKVVLLDPTGEFWKLNSERVKHVTLGNGQCLPEDAEEVSFPHSDLIESDLFALFRPSGQSQGPKLREAFRSLRLLIQAPYLADDDGTLVKRRKLRNPIEAGFATHAAYIESHRSYFSAASLAKQVREECIWPYDRNDQNRFGDLSNEEGYCLPLMMRIESIISSGDYACVFQPGELTSLVKTIDTFVDDDDKRLLRVSLQNVPFGNHAREVVANAIGRVLLDKARDSCFRDQPLLVVLDEAHQFLNQTIGDEYLRVELDAFGLIAKEGRKYGLTICIATQRPRDIPQDVLSQMGTLIVHRLINDRDREVVERAAGEIDRSAAEFLPTLGPGEAIIIGVDIPVPMAIQVQAPTAKPDSQGPNYQVYWSLPVEISASTTLKSLYGILSIQEFENSDYDLPEGESANGMTCQLQLVDQSLVIVGYGAVFWSVGCNWEVVEIDEVFESITIKRA
jgi:DNA helicase HerA-like ATPase